MDEEQLATRRIRRSEPPTPSSRSWPAQRRPGGQRGSPPEPCLPSSVFKPRRPAPPSDGSQDRQPKRSPLWSSLDADRRTDPNRATADEVATLARNPLMAFLTPSASRYRVSPVLSLREKTEPLLKRLLDRPGFVSPRKRSWALHLQGFAPPGERRRVSTPASSHAVEPRRNAASTPEA